MRAISGSCGMHGRCCKCLVVKAKGERLRQKFDHDIKMDLGELS
jgi:hypothetical protein